MSQDQFVGEFRCGTCEKKDLNFNHIIVTKPGAERPAFMLLKSVSCWTCLRDLWVADEAKMAAMIQIAVSHNIEL